MFINKNSLSLKEIVTALFFTSVRCLIQIENYKSAISKLCNRYSGTFIYGIKFAGWVNEFSLHTEILVENDRTVRSWATLPIESIT